MNDESNRLSARAMRFARVGANVGGVAARIAATRLLGMGNADAGSAAALRQALGSLKGPLMKVAQMLATIPDALPAEYAEELAKLQSDAPPMGAAFVKRRMQAELGQDWQARFPVFRFEAIRGCIARPGASCRWPRWQSACLQAAISGHGFGR